jgi:hypothetical protein
MIERIAARLFRVLAEIQSTVLAHDENDDVASVEGLDFTGPYPGSGCAAGLVTSRGERSEGGTRVAAVRCGRMLKADHCGDRPDLDVLCPGGRYTAGIPGYFLRLRQAALARSGADDR